MRLSLFASVWVMAIVGCLGPPRPDSTGSAPITKANQQQSAGAPTQRTIHLKCMITEEGRAEDCRVMSSPSDLDAEILSAISRARFTPLMVQGRPVRSRFIIPVYIKAGMPPSTGDPKDADKTVDGGAVGG